MTKELLYIPNGTYLTFRVSKDAVGSLEAYEKKWKFNSKKVIENILNGLFKEEFFKRNGLPEIKLISENHFEIVKK